ncbi:MAG TPA: AAA family ATPase [Polyangiaceae bacterium]|nr:AAA family ATPase [Polyangiaceae bacterium]
MASPADGEVVHFPPFRLCPLREQLWREDELVAVRPKTFAVLWYLISHSQRLVTKEELLNEVWGAVNVGDGVLKTSLKEIRQALADSVTHPRFVETAHGRGYRFIAAIAQPRRGSSSGRPAIGCANEPPEAASARVSCGRQPQLAQLRVALQRANTAQRQVVFVSGEAGIGKTHLMKAFLQPLETQGEVVVARGQCVEQSSGVERYLPVLEALSRLCRAPGGELLLGLLQREAPTWFARFAWARSPDRAGSLVAPFESARGGRRVRELADALDSFTRDRTLVLLLEDLHWADAATLDLIHHLAQRPDPARLLVLATYRPLDGYVENHERLIHMDRHLHQRGSCESLGLPCLDEAQLQSYLLQRFMSQGLVDTVLPIIRRRTSGNPCLVNQLLEAWISRGWLSNTAGEWRLIGELQGLRCELPSAIIDLVEAEKERLSPFQQNLLEVASLAGAEFCPVVVALALRLDVTRVEAECLRWARHGRIVRTPAHAQGSGPGTAFEFVHELFQQVISERLGAARRSRLHQLLLQATQRRAALEPHSVVLANDEARLSRVS